MDSGIKKLIKTALLYGALCAGLLMVLFVVLFVGGKHPQMINPVLDIRLVLLPVFMFLSLKIYRDNLNGGVLHLWQGLIGGAIIVVVVGLLMMAFISIYGQLETEYVPRYVSEITQFFEKGRPAFVEQQGEEVLDAQLEKLPHTTAFALALDYFWKTLLIGVFWNIIISIIIRKQPKF